MTTEMISITKEDYDLLCKVVFGTYDILDALSVTQDGLNRKEEDLFENTKTAIDRLFRIRSEMKE